VKRGDFYKPWEKVMQKELTINVDERVYDELQRIGGPEDISQFIESLILPQFGGLDLESAYQQMAEDETREAEALEWAEAMIPDCDEINMSRREDVQDLGRT
jgi:predicted CopG family antitoxin